MLVRLPIVTDSEYIYFIGPDIMTPKVHCKLLVKIIILVGINFHCIHLLEKFLVASMVVNIAPLSLRRALNFLRQSTVS